MSNPRHRAPEAACDPANLTPIAMPPRPATRRERRILEDQHRHQHTAVAAFTGSLILVSGMAGTAAATQQAQQAPRETTETGIIDLTVAPDIVADATAEVAFERADVASIAAPPPPPPPPAPAPPKAAPQPVQATKQAPAQQAAQTPAQAAPAPATGGKAAAIAAAALAQLGATQDCTALASNSLRAVGINFHDWPAGYLSLGPTVSADQAIPGDLIYYANGGMGVAHIAVYIGGGKAVHGGWNGNQTVIFSANVGSGPVFIRVR